jgi:hypothetical protein
VSWRRIKDVENDDVNVGSVIVSDSTNKLIVYL